MSKQKYFCPGCNNSGRLSDVNTHILAIFEHQHRASSAPCLNRPCEMCAIAIGGRHGLLESSAYPQDDLKFNDWAKKQKRLAQTQFSKPEQAGGSSPGIPSGPSSSSSSSCTSGSSSSRSGSGNSNNVSSSRSSGSSGGTNRGSSGSGSSRDSRSSGLKAEPRNASRSRSPSRARVKRSRSRSRSRRSDRGVKHEKPEVDTDHLIELNQRILFYSSSADKAEKALEEKENELRKLKKQMANLQVPGARALPSPLARLEQNHVDESKVAELQQTIASLNLTLAEERKLVDTQQSQLLQHADLLESYRNSQQRAEATAAAYQQQFEDSQQKLKQLEDNNADLSASFAQKARELQYFEKEFLRVQSELGQERDNHKFFEENAKENEEEVEALRTEAKKLRNSFQQLMNKNKQLEAQIKKTATKVQTEAERKAAAELKVTLRKVHKQQLAELREAEAKQEELFRRAMTVKMEGLEERLLKNKQNALKVASQANKLKIDLLKASMAGECSACLNAPPDCLFFCGHQALCTPCAKSWPKGCPVCRHPRASDRCSCRHFFLLPSETACPKCKTERKEYSEWVCSNHHTNPARQDECSTCKEPYMPFEFRLPRYLEVFGVSSDTAASEPTNRNFEDLTDL